MYFYNNAEQLLTLCQEHQTDIAHIALQSECETTGQSSEQIMEKLKHNLAVMEESIQKGLHPHLRSVGGLIGGNAYRLFQYAKQDPLSHPLILYAASYALAVTEVNASMGKIVAAPTAGASGILPGVLFALREARDLSQDQTAHALLVAAAIGKLIATHATLSGAEGGCQAECGSAAAMAAAAAVYIQGGQNEMCLDAAALALKGLLGLVCDPVAGLVEVPCSKRNATCVAHALICADMALAGIESFIPFDEMVDTMGRVGRQLAPALRETAQGGCAITPTALQYTCQLYPDQ
ncbi:MAG TPA: L-serine ammonia-lyase, iron-sulfur-dependent, subunit alpha [Syntrophomonadaceae bacterium]|jgi:L-serine dehydratase|nr:L-serine ammonia-lyase, iron-sulfur-dependent, subunit alpha [Syntrophomonadaceae bacterium]